MKPPPLAFLTIIGMSGLGFAGEGSSAPAERPRLTEELRMKVEGTSPPPSAIVGVAENGSLVLAPYKVKSTYVLPILKTQDAPEPESRPFNAQEGGYLWRRQGPSFAREVKLQYSPRNRAFEFLRFSW